jgi:signal transduction histidine kinase
VLGVVVDITDRRLLQEQFLQAQKMETAGQFASGIAHDLNNIMTVITGFCDLLETDDTISDVTRGRVGEISAAAARGNGLAQQLLTFGRKGSTSPQLLDPNDAMSRFEAFANTLAAPHCVRLRLGSDVGCIRVDPRHLDQAVMNLVVNARDAMAEAGVITITTASTDAGAVTIGVSDTGSGMDEATRRRMFEPFYTTKGAGKGTGLGLAVVRSVIDSAQGEVTVDSVPGRGTTVELHFPRVVLNRRGPA